MLYKFPLSVPTYNSRSDNWSYTEFSTIEEFREFLLPLFKEPGEYGFDETAWKFNESARYFNENKRYFGNNFPKKSKDFVTWWNSEKEKNTRGCIFIGEKDTWYLTRDYNMWINFLKIYNKEENNFTFPNVMDVQYHMALYELLAELHYKHCPILKKRQIASSYFHCAKLINGYWFENGGVFKMGASREDYINLKGSWRFLNEYRDFLNKHTAWYRPNNPDKTLNWQQKIEFTSADGRKTTQGNKSLFTGTSFEKDATAGVGGPCLLKNTLICMSDGSYKPVQDIKVGDFVAGIDGLPKRVHKLYSGFTEMYKVEQSRGIDYTVTGDHILYLWHHDKKEYIKVKAAEFNQFSKYQREKKLSGFKASGLDFFEKELPIDPYYLGLYLGDGCKYDFTILVNKTKDHEVADYIESMCGSEGRVLKTKHKNLYRENYKDEMWEMSVGVGKSRTKSILENSFSTQMRSMGVSQKHIPVAYFSSSRSQRLALLAGLIDTDGYWNNKKARYEISMSQERLAMDIVKLCRQLGLNTQWCIVHNNGEKSTVSGKAHSIFRVNITGKVMQIPCKIERKKATWESPMASDNFSKLKVSPYGEGEYYGFECEDNLFLLEDLTVTHNCTIFFHEEAGIAPKMGVTFSFMKPAMRFGHITTGIFIAAGSVGELDKCKPLEEMILKPTSDFYTVKTNLLDENWTEGVTGLFIPEQWGMMPYIDQYGNSLVQEALDAIVKERELWKKEFTPEQYQYEISQHPINIKEAFAWRKEAVFPTHLIEKRLKEIEAGEVFLEYLDIYRDENGKPQFKPSKRIPNSYPVDKKQTDKRGCCVVHKRPEANPERGRYYCSIDPVSEGKTSTSESLFAITVYEMPIERTIHEEGGIRIEIDGDKEVLSWVGRFDDINETHEWASLIIEMYNAEAVVEANVSLFINYMILKRRHHMLVTSSQLVFNQEQKNKNNQHHTYGWKNVGTIFKGHLISYSIEHCKEVIDQKFDPNGNVLQTVYGVNRITTPRKLKEMLSYQDGVNVDELVAWTALIAFVKLQTANRGYKKVVEYKENLNTSGELYKLNYRSPFNNIGKPSNSSTPPQYRKRQNPFKNIR